MAWYSDFPSPAGTLVLVALAVVSLLISGVTLLVVQRMRRQSAPSRESVLKIGLCLILAWPLIVLGGAMAGLSLATVESSEPPVTTANEAAGVANLISESTEAAAMLETPLAAPTRPERVFWTPGPMSLVTSNQKAEPLPAEPTPAQPAMAFESTPPPTAEPHTATVWAVPQSMLFGLRWGSLLWGIGTIISLALLLKDVVRVRRMQRRLKPCPAGVVTEVLAAAMRATGLKQAPALVLSTDVGSPCVSGMRRPLLILPERMFADPHHNQAELLAILTHECAHLVRRDVAWSLLARVAQAIYWWEPGLRRILRQLSHLREEICDNHVLATAVDARVYAKTLVDFAAGPVFRPMIGVIGMVGKNNPLADRVERLLQDSPDKTTRLGRRSKWAVALLVILNCGLFGVIGAEANLPQVLSQVLTPSVKNYPSSDVALDSDLRPGDVVPPASGESPVPTAPQSKDATMAFAPIGVPTEAGSRVSAPQEMLSPFDGEPTKAGSGVAAPEWAEETNAPFPTNDSGELHSLTEPIPKSSIPSRELSSSVFEDSPAVNGLPVTEYVHRTVHYIDGGILKTRVVMVPLIRIHRGISPAQLHNMPGRSFTLDLPSEGTFTHGEQYALTVTLPEGDILLPKTIRFEGLIAVVPESLSAETPEPPAHERQPPLTGIADPLTPEISPEITPPAPPEAEAATPDAPPAASAAPEPASRAMTFVAPTHVVAAWNSLKDRGGTAVVTKRENPAELAKPPVVAPDHRQFPPHERYRFHLPLEAVADATGQFMGLRCWGRDLPSTAPDKGIAELTKTLESWKAECEKARASGQLLPPESDPFSLPDARPTTASPPQLLVELRVFDSMRYGDVRAIVQACESLKLSVNVLNTTAETIGSSGYAYASIELTRVYDKQGKPVGQRSLMLAQKAAAQETQVITDDHWDQALSRFTNRHGGLTTVLIVKVDPDLPNEMLQSFYVRANRWGVDRIVLQQSELQLRDCDVLVPLINETPMRSDSHLTPVPEYESSDAFRPDQRNELMEPPIDEPLEAAPLHRGTHRTRGPGLLPRDSLLTNSLKEI